MFLRSILLLVVLAVSGALGASAKRAITHEDLWLMLRVDAPVLSPDGRWAVVSVTAPASEAGKQTADLWLVARGGVRCDEEPATGGVRIEPHPFVSSCARRQ